MVGKKRSIFLTLRNKKIFLIICLVIICVLFINLAVQMKPRSGYKSRAAEVAPRLVVPTPVPPDLIGKIVSLQDINSGNTVMIISGTGKKDYLEALNVKKVSPQEQKYLLILTPKTIITKLGDDTTIFSKNTMKKDMNVYVYTTADLAVGLKVINIDK